MTYDFRADHHPSKPEFGPDGEPVAAVDWLGNRFAVGDRVIYCIAAGHGQMMAVGTAIKIKTKERTGTINRDPEPGETPNQYGHIAEKVSYHDVAVLVLTEKTSGRWDNKARNKPAWVNPMNITSLTGLRQGRRNTHCSNCGDERGGPIGHEISECRLQEADR